MSEPSKPERERTKTRQPEPKCAICGRPVAPDFRPFCSRRCADADLGRWLTGDYRIPGPALEESDPEGQDGEN